MDSTVCNLSSEEYHNGEPYKGHLSSTQLKLFGVSPKAYAHSLENPREQTDALRFGSLFHDLMASLAHYNGVWDIGYGKWLLGLARFDPPINEKTGQAYGASTKAYTEAYQQFLSDNGDKSIVNATESDLASDMAHSLLFGCGSTSKQVRELLKWGEPEVSHFVEVDGVKCKYRPDLETKKKIIDYKTIANDDLSERSINSAIAKFGYDVSAAYYLFLEHERTGVWKSFYWIFVSKVPPFDAVMADASEWTYKLDPDTGIAMPQVGAIKMRRLWDLHLNCAKTSVYPGAEIHIPSDEFGRRIMKPCPPPWEISKTADILDQSF